MGVSQINLHIDTGFQQQQIIHVHFVPTNKKRTDRERERERGGGDGRKGGKSNVFWCYDANLLYDRQLVSNIKLSRLTDVLMLIG